MHRVVRAQGRRRGSLDSLTPRGARTHPRMDLGCRDVGALAVGAVTPRGGAGGAVQAGAADSIDRIATRSAPSAAATLHAVRADSTDTSRPRSAPPPLSARNDVKRAQGRFIEQRGAADRDVATALVVGAPLGCAADLIDLTTAAMTKRRSAESDDDEATLSMREVSALQG